MSCDRWQWQDQFHWDQSPSLRRNFVSEVDWGSWSTKVESTEMITSGDYSQLVMAEVVCMKDGEGCAGKGDITLSTMAHIKEFEFYFKGNGKLMDTFNLKTQKINSGE